jgi:hypothetical protein
VDRIFKSWNVTVRNIFRVPFTTHRFLIEPISASMHPKTMLTSRFVKFVDSLASSHKSSIRFLVNMVKDDNRKLTGKLRAESVLTQTLGDPVCPPPLSRSQWGTSVCQLARIGVDMVLELLNLREGSLEIDDLESDEVTTLLNYLCTT